MLTLSFGLSQLKKFPQLVKYAYENNIPVCSGQYLRRICMVVRLPQQGGIVIDMKNMNKILEIDLKHKFVRFQPGVTWKSRCAKSWIKVGARIMMPFTPLGNRSVLSDTLDRCVITNTVYDYGEITPSLLKSSGVTVPYSVPVPVPFTDLQQTILRLHGLHTPSRGVDPSGPGLDFYRIVQGAQGTMGIITWMSAKLELKSQIDKIYFAPIDDLDYANEFLYRRLCREESVRKSFS